MLNPIGEPMTIRIPRYLLGGLAAALLIGGGLVLGLALGDNGPVTASAKPPCTPAAAKRAVLDSKFVDDVLRGGAVSLPSQLFSTYSLHLVGCRDLTGDSNPEMVVQLSCCTAGAWSPWAIFTPQESRWRLMADRLQTPEAQLRLTSAGVRETTPTWAPGDAMCCSSGNREGVLSYQDGHFVYQPRIGPTNRTSVVALNASIASPALVKGSIAGFDLLTGSLPRAVELFGTPTNFGGPRWSCPAKWRDIGLEIGFYTLSGAYQCGRNSRVEWVVLEGHEAEQASWHVNGLYVGMPFSDVQRLHPDARPEGGGRRKRLQSEEKEGTPFVLAEKETGYAGRLPAIVVRAAYGAIVAIELNVTSYRWLDQLASPYLELSWLTTRHSADARKPSQHECALAAESTPNEHHSICIRVRRRPQ